MKISLVPSLLALALVTAFALHGCSLTHDKFSCNVLINGVRDKCVDFSNVGVAFRVEIETLCHSIGGDFSTSASCPDADKVAACQQVSTNYTITNWYYTDGPHPTVADAAGKCSGPEKCITPSGGMCDLAPDMSAQQDLSSNQDASHD